MAATVEIEWRAVPGVSGMFLVENRWRVTATRGRVEIFDKRARPPRVMAVVDSLPAARTYLANLINPPKGVFNRPDQTPSRGPYRGNEGDDAIKTFDMNDYLLGISTRSR